MKAKLIGIENYDEIAKVIETNERLSLSNPVPEEKEIITDIYFNPEYITLSYLDKNNNIVCKIEDEFYTLAYSKELIDFLETKFK